MKFTNDMDKVWWKLYAAIPNKHGVAGLMGNLYAESGINPVCLENLCIKRYKEKGITYTSGTYMKAVDLGTISRQEFISPMGKHYGWGLCQLTAEGRKAGFYDLCKRRNASIGDLNTQIEYLYYELENSFKGVLKVLLNVKSVKEASDKVLADFERPADWQNQKDQRAAYGQEIYNHFAGASNMINDTAIKGGNAMSNIDNAFAAGKKALCGDYTAYTPAGKALFAKVGRYGKTPHVGDLIYFYTSSLGRISHVGGVIEVIKDGNIYAIKTIEGNSAAGKTFSRDGGESAVKSYAFSLDQVGGGNRIDGFGSPVYGDSTCTAEEFVTTLKEWVGYVEKTKKSLDNMVALTNKLADPGDDNVTLFGHWYAQTYGSVYKTGQWCSMYCMYAMYNACKAHLAKKKTGWEKDDRGWKYRIDGAIVSDGWQQIGGRWYVFIGGYVLSNTWFKQEKYGAVEWYYLGEDCAMLSGQWLMYKGCWYYLCQTGLMATSCWIKDSKGWCYIDAEGKWDGKYMNSLIPGAEIAI